MVPPIRSEQRCRSSSVMRRRTRRRTDALLCLALGLVAGTLNCGKRGYVAPKPSHPLRFYDADGFRTAVHRAARFEPRVRSSVLGGVVPHHLPASYLMARLFRTVARGRKPSTVVVLAPNHRHRGVARILTSRYAWETPSGLLLPDDDLIRALVQQEVAVVEDSVFAAEHSIGALVPFVKFYLPETRIAPILLGPLGERETRRLATVLASATSHDGLLVASVDFSHHLSRRQADAKDRETLDLIRSCDVTHLLTLDDHHTDCPAALATLLLVMRQRGAVQMHVWGHDNSGAILNNDTTPSTGYYCLAFTERDR